MNNNNQTNGDNKLMSSEKTFSCICGYETNKEIIMRKHLKSKWTFVDHAVNKNGHTLEKEIEN